MGKSIKFCIDVATSSNTYERNNSELKRLYIIRNIEQIKQIISNVTGYIGCFGTGYPFYILDDNMQGQLPIIEEQIRYNNELINFALMSHHETWVCANCLDEFGDKMPDLKQICYRCTKIEKELRPRKVINRLPDIDIWMICEDDKVEFAKQEIQDKLLKNNIYPSDINPIKTIEDVFEITSSIESGQMPTKNLPLDIHIVKYSEILALINYVPGIIAESIAHNAIPFLPIHPISLRKRWQYDDTPYNFILDFLLSFTPLEIDKSLSNAINESRSKITSYLSIAELNQILLAVSPDSVKRRLRTKEMQNRYESRIKSWKK